MQPSGTPNWAPKTIWTGDCLYVMRGMNSASVDLIYLDPPFNSKTNYAAPIGSKAAGAAFKDTWILTDIDVEWINLIETKHPFLNRVLIAAMTDSDKSYLVYMAARLLEMKRLLKSTGSIYLHCDPTMSHYLKLVMDAIFGRNAFRNEFVWLYDGRELSKKRYNNKHDVLLYYAKGKETTFNWGSIATPLQDSSRKALQRFVDEEGNYYLLRYSKGGGFAPKHMEGKAGVYRQYVVDKVPPRDWAHFDYARKGERTGYPTQKPLALLRHIIKTSSHRDDVVLDPFCGCATTCVAADDLGRDWVGIDISPKAAELVVDRISGRQGLYRNIVHREDIPARTDLGRIRRYNSTANRTYLYGKQGGDCAGCGTHFEKQHLEVDHIISRNKGGTDHKENLQLLCSSCNRRKGDRGMAYLQTKLQLAA